MKTAIQQQFIETYPELALNGITKDIADKFNLLIKESGIKNFGPDVEVWTSDASNKALSYATHGIFRYFGKFPPPIARYLIKTYTKPNDLVIDPMCGSGTTGLEASLLGRSAACYDVNPLSVLISKVKTTPININKAKEALDTVNEYLLNDGGNKYPLLIGLRNPEHWFLKETLISLNKIRDAIEQVKASPDIKNFLTLSFLAVVRRVSRATTQQGRLFLDVETAEANAIPFFLKRAEDTLSAISKVPKGDVRIIQDSILDKNNNKKERSPLIICHPPYFNSYKYSGVNSLELAWMNIDHASIRKNEVREAFKVGKPEKVEEYLSDMANGLANLSTSLEPNGRLALMIGDTVIRGKYIPVTKLLLKRIDTNYAVERAALRIPKFTEASWAASQRRKGGEIGINLCDLLVILKKK